MKKNILIAVGVFVFLLSILIFFLQKYKDDIKDATRPGVTVTDNISKSKVVKTLITDKFSIDYPEYLEAGEDVYMCDWECKSTPVFYFFANKQYGSDSYNNEVARIDVIEGLDIKTLSNATLPNKRSIDIEKNSFVTGNTGSKQTYYVQGRGFALKIVFKKPKENNNYDGYPNLGTLVLKH